MKLEHYSKEALTSELRRRMRYTLDDYQAQAARTSDAERSADEQLTNGVLGLSGEAGEVTELVKKYRYHGVPLCDEQLTKELGDVLWYVAKIASSRGLSLGTIGQKNIEKLRARYPEGFEEGGGNR